MTEEACVTIQSYGHPGSHPPGIITEDELNRFVTDVQIAAWAGCITDLAAHEADATVHGIAGDVVGTTDTQTLTNKTLTTPVINNPTGIVKSDVGLDSVDNTSDADKPVSVAQQSALDLKANIASPTFTGTVSGITSTMVGLGDVDNTADTDKPVSTAQAAADALKMNIEAGAQTGVFTFGGGASGDIATMTFTNGVLTAVTTVA